MAINVQLMARRSKNEKSSHRIFIFQYSKVIREYFKFVRFHNVSIHIYKLFKHEILLSLL